MWMDARSVHIRFLRLFSTLTLSTLYQRSHPRINTLLPGYNAWYHLHPAPHFSTHRGFAPELYFLSRCRNRTAPKLTTSIICDQRNQSSFFLTIDSNFCLICCQAPTFISFRFRSKCILGTNTFVAQKRLISQKTIGRKKSSKIKWPETGKLSATICLRRSLKAKTAK